MFDEEVDRYNTYEDYLDSLVSEEDHFYLEDEEMARIIAELGYRWDTFLLEFWLLGIIFSSIISICFGIKSTNNGDCHHSYARASYT